MAIAPDILIALRIEDTDEERPVIKLANTNPRFPKRDIEIDTSRPEEPVHIDSKTLGTLYIPFFSQFLVKVLAIPSNRCNCCTLRVAGYSLPRD